MRRCFTGQNDKWSVGPPKVILPRFYALKFSRAECKYGYFPSVSAARDISQGSFFKSEAVNQLKVRISYGRTGNQEFPAGSSRSQFAFPAGTGNNALNQITNYSPNLKWQSDEQYDAGLDMAFFNNRVTVTADCFYKRTTDLLYPNIPGYPAAPGGSSVVWDNLPGIITNKGPELRVGVTAVDNTDFGLNFNANATCVHHNVTGLNSALITQTGPLSGQGLTGVLAETIQNGQPINAFRLPVFTTALLPGRATSKLPATRRPSRDVHSMLYHLYSFSRAGTDYSPSPMGLSGLGYNGHVFWDTDVWMFPALLVLHPDLAKSMVE